MNYCPQCGTPLTSQKIKFCPECGCNLKALQRVDMECPDCGMVFDRQAIPNECPTCGCPSERFKVHEDDAEINAELITTPENEQPENEQPKKTSIKPFLITLLFVIAGGLFIYYAGQPKEGRIIGPTTLVEDEEQAAEESASEDGEEQEEREEQEAKEQVEREQEQALSKFVGTYTSDIIDGGEQSGRGRFYITFYSDKTFELKFVDVFTRNILHQQRGRYTFFYKESPNEAGVGRLIDNRGNFINYYYVRTLGFSIDLGDYYMTK